MDLLGLPLGPVTLVVGTDDDALDAAVEAAVGRRPFRGNYGVAKRENPHTLDLWVRLNGRGNALGIADLGDSLHPAQHKALVARLRACGVPVVATTHSPYLADHFTADEVIVLTTGGARRLSDHPDARLRESLSTGELLVASGAGWWWP
jgi:hypothetical protein